MPALCPERTRLVRAPRQGWGRAHAVHTGALASEAEALVFLDADMLFFRDHVEALMRWHHTADDLAVTGHLRFVEDTSERLSPDEVFEAIASGTPELLTDAPGEELAWLREAYDASRDLRSAGHSVYSYFIGGTGSVRREFYLSCGGMDPELVLGEDTHLGFRLAQGGAVFVPETGSSSLHLGRPQMEERKEDGARFRRPFVGNRLPLSPSVRQSPGRQWQVPLVDVVVDVGEHRFDDTTATVDSLLAGDVSNIRVTLVGHWPRVDAGRHDPLDAPDLHMRLLREHYRCEPRVRTAASPPPRDPDVPHRLTVRPGHTYARHAVERMIRRIDRARAGLLRATLPGDDLGGPRLERTAAFARAERLAGGDDRDAAVARTHGLVWIDARRELLAAQGATTAVPDDWEQRLEAVRAETDRYRARADRLSRLCAWLTESRTGRALSGLGTGAKGLTR
nr:glycosyltransferase family 2 protein [Nocardiopsis salina]